MRAEATLIMLSDCTDHGYRVTSLKDDLTQASCFVMYPNAAGVCLDLPVHTDYIKPTEPVATVSSMLSNATVHGTIVSRKLCCRPRMR